MLDVRALSYTYPGTETPAIRDLAFAIAPGEIFGFLGPSGSGKSTTQKVLMGLLRGYAGAVTVFDRDLATWGADYYERVGVSFELPNHYGKLTARENLTYFGSLYAGETEGIDVLLETVGIGDAADQRVGAFSKGMKLRLNLARALLHRPTLLFLDEPTAGLDPVTARRIKDIIRQQQQRGATVFLTTHDMVVADDLCDRVAFIVDGQIQLVDEPRRLKRQYGERAVRIETGDPDTPTRHDFPLDGLGTNPAFLAALRNGPIQTIHTLETTLEDVFVQVTGRALQ
ncbi:MAG: ABC transporter ATP-binding protein [Rhodothermaceae bacterium]|nr:ABC transporter ATP-binding protein [Rhodothermaceae bacterium]